MLEKAKEKLLDEMGSNDSAYVQAVGGMLLDHIGRHPSDAEKILAEGKTISGSLKEMQSVARGKASGGVAVLTDAEGFAVVLKYFGIGGGQAAEPAPAADFSTSLDAYL
jgi:hypothetical protein